MAHITLGRKKVRSGPYQPPPAIGLVVFVQGERRKKDPFYSNLRNPTPAKKKV